MVEKKVVSFFCSAFPPKPVRKRPALLVDERSLFLSLFSRLLGGRPYPGSGRERREHLRPKRHSRLSLWIYTQHVCRKANDKHRRSQPHIHVHAQPHRSKRACLWVRAHLLSFLCSRRPHSTPARPSPASSTQARLRFTKPGRAWRKCFYRGGREVLPTRAEAARAGRADLAGVLGTSGGGWEGRASRVNVDWLLGGREAGSEPGAGLSGPFKALTSGGGSGTPLSLPPAPSRGHGPGGSGLPWPSSTPDFGEFWVYLGLKERRVRGGSVAPCRGKWGVEGKALVAVQGRRGRRGFLPKPYWPPLRPSLQLHPPRGSG